MSQEIPVDAVVGVGNDDNESGSAAHHGDGQYIARNGSDPADDFTRRLVVAVYGGESGYDSQCKPPDRGGYTYYRVEHVFGIMK